jgi:hypothetical protein
MFNTKVIKLYIWVSGHVICNSPACLELETSTTHPWQFMPPQVACNVKCLEKNSIDQYTLSYPSNVDTYVPFQEKRLLL